MFDADQFNSYWLWFTYSASKNFKVSLSPFGYFESYILYINPTDLERAREEQQLEEAAGMGIKSFAGTRRDREIQRKKIVLEAKIASLNEEFESVKDELNKTQQEEEFRRQVLERNRGELTKKRYLNENAGKPTKGHGKSK